MQSRSSNKYRAQKSNSDSIKWKRLRQSVLKRDDYIDQIMLRKGKIVQATIVHHIFPKEIYPQYEYCMWNLISVSWDTHLKVLHNARTGELTKEGKALLMETALREGIKLRQTVLVIGEQGTGKTTYVQTHIGGGIAYDLDYIASAFRLAEPHSEYHVGARKLANRLLKGFIEVAHEVSSEVYIIRTHPSEEELQAISPTKIVLCTHRYDISRRKDAKETSIALDSESIKNAVEFANKNHIEVEYSPPR